jgi:hypothetical protein
MAYPLHRPTRTPDEADLPPLFVPPKPMPSFWPELWHEDPRNDVEQADQEIPAAEDGESFFDLP